MKQYIILCLLGTTIGYITLVRQVYAESNTLPRAAQNHVKQQTLEFQRQFQQWMQRYKYSLNQKNRTLPSSPQPNPCGTGKSYVHVYQRITVNGQTTIHDEMKCQNSSISISDKITVTQ